MVRFRVGCAGRMAGRCPRHAGPPGEIQSSDHALCPITRFGHSLARDHSPVAPHEPHESRQLGRVRVDAYAWMRFIPPSGTRMLDNLPPRLRGHLNAETRYARDVLGPLEPAARWFRERLAAVCLSFELAVRDLSRHPAACVAARP
ncbi:hypothetical protein CDEN61S_02464 [Castellaniella denitrificans]